jgi:hypothetical protein
MIYRVLADAILVFHVLYIAFVVGGQLLIVIGLLLKWTWVRNFWFRILHLAAIWVVVLQAWVGVICPLTDWENALRVKAGQTTYTGGFIQYWLHKLIFFEADPWVFGLVYTVFGTLVLLTWFYGPPQRRKPAANNDH